MVDLQLDSCSVIMELDTGASSLISISTFYKKLWSKCTLSVFEVKLYLLKATNYAFRVLLCKQFL